jgi:hypothetical protein
MSCTYAINNTKNPTILFRYNVRHIALKIAYLGWDYHGFASQENIENTIEVPSHLSFLKSSVDAERKFVTGYFAAMYCTSMLYFFLSINVPP